MAQYNQSPASETHLKRYYRSKQGESVTEIAQKDGVSEQAVKESIRSIELYRARHDVQVLNEAVVGAVLTVVPEVQKSIKRQLNATTVVEAGGKKRREPDWQVQRAAVAEVRGLIQTVQPKAPNVHSTQVAVGVGQGQVPRLATGSYVGMEDRLKTITQELEAQPLEVNRKQLMQAPLQPIDDAEYEDSEPVESEP